MNSGEPRAGRSSTARRELVENELYEHATRLFAERGFAGTSLQDIAEAMGITRPALYYYVKSKDELLAKLVTEVTDGPLDELTALVARDGLDPVQKLRGIVEVIVGRRTTQPARFRLLIRSEAELPAELTTAYADSRRAVLKVIAGRGRGGGARRPVPARRRPGGRAGRARHVQLGGLVVPPRRPRHHRVGRRAARRHGRRRPAAPRRRRSSTAKARPRP